MADDNIVHLATMNDAPPAVTKDALALRFAETNVDLRFVAVWPRWFEWTTNRWRADEKLHAMSLARVTCRQAAGEAQ